MRSVKQELDIDLLGNVGWVVTFYEDPEDEHEYVIAYKHMDTAREAGRRWIVGTANTYGDLTEVDRFKDDLAWA